MTRLSHLLLVTCLGALAPTTSALAADKPDPSTVVVKGKWEMLGQRTEDGGVDKDVIEFGHEDGLYDALGIAVRGSSMTMQDIKIVFADGEVYAPKTRIVFNKESVSQVIDLPGNTRVIQRIEFRYTDFAAGGKAKVSVMGHDVQPNWQKLGERTVEAKLDRDIIQVGKNGVRAIRVKVEDSAMMMFEIKVVFGNDEVFEPKVRLVFNKDTGSRVIDLPGEKRHIKRVEFKYMDLPGSGKAKVVLMGR